MKTDFKYFAVFMISILSTSFGYSQDIEISGKVIDLNDNNPLAGVSVIVENTQKGTMTDFDGNYSITADSGAKLIFSFIGYAKQVVAVDGRSEINITLQESAEKLDEVIITGVFDERTRMESSIAISTLGVKEIQQQAPVSAADLLKNVSGVFVNSSLGEIRNTVYSRGVSVGSNDGASGYFYVSLQEDGLPITNATFANFGPDFYLRSDATLARLEAVKGGTASLLGNNAPGGIFNYISKTGGKELEGNVILKYGLEGELQNPYYRADFNIGGPLNQAKDLTFNIGGFYRRSDGASNPGYPMNNGGQIKANIFKSFKGGSLKFYTKILDDRNAWFAFLPTRNFDDPTLVEGIDRTTSFFIPPVTANFTVNDTGEEKFYDSRDKAHSRDYSVGLLYKQEFGKGWSLNNNARYSDKSTVWNTTAVVYPFALDTPVFYFFNRLLGNFGNYSFRDNATGELLGNISQLPQFDQNGNFAGFNFVVNESNFPGSEVSPNSLLFNPLQFTENKMKEFINQFSISKKFENMNFTGGFYYANSVLDRLNGLTGFSFGTITDPRPRLTDISYVNQNNELIQVTNPEGINGGSGVSEPIDVFDVEQNQFAAFLGHNWSISEKLNLDWGLRVESINIKGANQNSIRLPSDTPGGVDGNPNTFYDNWQGIIADTFTYDETINTFSLSAGLNYRISEEMAVYARYSSAEKAPDMDIFILIDTELSEESINPLAQDINQFEMGFKLRTKDLDLFVTPFYSNIDNTFISQTFQETNDAADAYNPPILFNEYETFGVELEGNYRFTNNLSLRSVATFQRSEAKSFRTWIANENGIADDEIRDFSGNETDNTPNLILRLSPTYTTDKIFAQVNWSYLGDRQANIANTFVLPGFAQTDLALGYNFSDNINVTLNVNNVFNTFGVMSWSAPGVFPAALDRQGFTPDRLAANPDAIFSVISIPPTSAFLTLNYSF